MSLLHILVFCVACLQRSDAKTAPDVEQTSSRVSTVVSEPSSPVEVWGHERITWDQYAFQAEALRELVFTSFVDGYAEQLEDVRCASERGVSGFECSARLPRMAPGPHTIEIAATSGTEISGRSTGLAVVFRPGTASDGMRVRGALQIEQIVGSLNDVADIAVLPSGIVLAAESSGRILSIQAGQPPKTAFDLRTFDRTEGRPTLLAVAVDTAFSENHSVFAAYSTSLGLRLVRFTESQGMLHSHAILREGLSVDPVSPHAAIRIGPDRKIYLAVEREVWRLDLDGSTPEDGPTSGAFASGLRRPADLVWSDDGRTLWLIGAGEDGTNKLRTIARGDRGIGTTVGTFDLSGTDGSAATLLSAAGSANRLVLATGSTGDLMQWLITGDGRPTSGIEVSRTGLGVIAALSSDANGTIWAASRSAIYRLSPPTP